MTNSISTIKVSTKAEEIGFRLIKGERLTKEDMYYLRKNRCGRTDGKLTDEEVRNTPYNQLSSGYKARQTEMRRYNMQ